MLFNGSIEAIICCFTSILVLCHATNARDVTQDQTTSRANTLFDDADDIQRQLDNEIRDRFGQFKTVWVFHVPSRNDVQSVTPATDSNEISIRLKRKQSKIGNKNFKFSRDSKKEKEPKDPCTCCGQCPGETSTGECTSKPNCTKCEENPVCECKNTEDKQDEPYSVEAPPEAAKPKEPEWCFWNQNKWHEKFKDCGGHAQSPVNLPVEGLIHAKGARKLIFSNYDVKADNLTVVNDGKRVVMYGHWPKHKWPLVYGGAAHSRRYLFHSLSVYWPSEHSVGGLFYPLETQLLHISAEYCSYDEAIKAAPKDPMAFLGIVNIYKYSKCSHPGLTAILKAASKCRGHRMAITPTPLANFSAPFSDHVCYYGSLTTPPCTEAVLWLVRRRSLPVSRESMSLLQHMLCPPSPPVSELKTEIVRMNTRMYQPLNDRKVYLFT